MFKQLHYIVQWWICLFSQMYKCYMSFLFLKGFNNIWKIKNNWLDPFCIFWLRIQHENQDESSEVSHHLKRTTAILELLQHKMNVEEPHLLLPTLFSILTRYSGWKFCLNQSLLNMKHCERQLFLFLCVCKLKLTCDVSKLWIAVVLSWIIVKQHQNTSCSWCFL